MTEKAMRFNEGKPQLSYALSARYALEGLSRVLEKGALKYERDNWKKGMPAEEIIDCLLRHLVKYLDGEIYDDETGCHHLDHALCNSVFLSYHHNGLKQQAEKKKEYAAEVQATTFGEELR